MAAGLTIGHGARAEGVKAKNTTRDKDLALAMLEFAHRSAPGLAMEAEQLNQIANSLADLKTRTAEMRRFL
jgi:hypothetical protein